MAIKVTNMEIEIDSEGKAFLIIKTMASGHIVSHIPLELIPGLPKSILKDQEEKVKKAIAAREKMEKEKAAQDKINAAAMKAAQEYDSKKADFISKAVNDTRKKLGL